MHHVDDFRRRRAAEPGLRVAQCGFEPLRPCTSAGRNGSGSGVRSVVRYSNMVHHVEYSEAARKANRRPAATRVFRDQKGFPMNAPARRSTTAQPLDRLQELLDRQDILDCVHRYCRAVDRFDRELLLSVYHPDAIDDHGLFVGGREAFADWAFGYHSLYQNATHHIVTNHTCELDGDVAHAETYWMFSGANRDPESGADRALDAAFRSLHRPLRAPQRHVGDRRARLRDRVARRARRAADAARGAGCVRSDGRGPAQPRRHLLPAAAAHHAAADVAERKR